MSSKNLRFRTFLMLLIFAVVASVPTFAGSAVIGSVAGSMNATIGGQTLMPNTTIFSGDSLQVRDGVAVVAIGNSSRLVFGRETTASFLRGSDGVTVLLSQGDVSMYNPGDGAALRVKVGEVSVAPVQGFKTLGEIAMAGGTVVVTAKEGQLRVEGNGSARMVATGKTITIPGKAARAPRPSPAGPTLGNVDTATALSAGALAAGGTAAVLAGIGISRANDARDAANAAGASATSAANVADSDALAALSAANEANSNAVAAGCALNTVAVNGDIVAASPFTPAGGETAPGC